MIKVMITEDNKSIREGLTILLDGTEGLSCIGQFRSCEDMFIKLPEDPPDLILMDIGLPGMSGIEAIPKVHEIDPSILILILSVYEDDDNIFQALCAGACGYLVKKTPPAQLISAIVEASEGGSPMNSHIARKVVGFFKQKMIRKSTDNILSERETEILSGLSGGNSYKMIADSLFISIDTVRYHIRNIYKKLQVHSQSEAVSKAMRKGWI